MIKFFLPFLILTHYAASLFSQSKTMVYSTEELVNVVKNSPPGSEIILAKNVFIDQNMVLTGQGTADKPIIIRSKSAGKNQISAEISLQGNYLHFVGFTFTGRNGNVIIDGTYCRVNRCTFTDSKAKKWIRVRPGSLGIEIDYNLFENKTNNLTEKSCQLMQVMVRNKNEKHHIHHNLFRNIPPGEGNGYETIQLITEGNPFDPPGGHCNTVIEDNLFIRCNGEAEIISIKSNGNLIRRNTFRACKGGLVLRHGDDNVVLGNFFFGDEEPGSGGVRLQGSGQVVVHNYFHGLGNYGIAMMDGTPDDLYVRVDDALIGFNTFVRGKKDLVIGLNHSKHPNGTPPRNCQMVGNIFYDPSPSFPGSFIEFIQGDQPVDWIWEDNVAFDVEEYVLPEGVRKMDPHLRSKHKHLTIPTRDTPKSNYKFEVVHLKDLMDNQVHFPTNVGAIQYPAASKKQLWLTDKKVGPKARPY